MEQVRNVGSLLCCTDGPVLASPAERNGRDRAARERVQALAGVKHLGAGDLGVESLDVCWGTVHDGGARIDDGLESGVDLLAAYERRGAADLPEPG